MSEHENEAGGRPAAPRGVGFLMGTALGVVLGVVSNRIGVGVGIGAGLGLVFDLALARRARGGPHEKPPA